MCWDAQAVILLRSLRIAKGGAAANAETQRMITEKIAALGEAQLAATVATLKGSKKDRVAKKALAVYATRVRRNRRRLSKIVRLHRKGDTLEPTRNVESALQRTVANEGE